MGVKKILIIGFGIDEARTEAVSLNTSKLVRFLESIGWEVHIINIGYRNQSFFTGRGIWHAISMVPSIQRQIIDYVNRNGITLVLDVFVLPLSTLIFTSPLVKKLPQVKFIKEIHNDAGFSYNLHFETFIRLFANNRFLFNKVIHSPFKKFTRNKHLSQKYGIEYLPSPVVIKPFHRPSRHKDGKIRISYLGHPLKKKGIFEFPTLFTLLPPEIKQKVIFNFALSNIGDQISVGSTLKEAARENGVTITVKYTVKPSVFFRSQDFYILPIHDQFGAVSSPNTILEAMEAGAISIVTNIASLEGIIVDGVTGVFMKNYHAHHIWNALQPLLEDEAKQNKLRKAARHEIEKDYAEEKIKNTVRKLLC